MKKYRLMMFAVLCAGTFVASCQGGESLIGIWEGDWHPARRIDFAGTLDPPYAPIPVEVTLHKYDDVFDSYGHIQLTGEALSWNIWSVRADENGVSMSYSFEIGETIRALGSFAATMPNENMLVAEDFGGHGASTTGPPGFVLSSGGRMVLTRTVPEPHWQANYLAIVVLVLGAFRKRRMK